MGGQEVIRTVEELLATNSPCTYDEWKTIVGMYLLMNRSNPDWNVRYPGWSAYIAWDTETGRVARAHDARYREEFGVYHL